MRHLAIQSVGTALAVESIHAVAVYRKKDGRVCHLHHVITYAGAERRPQREHERNARSYAEKMGHDPDGLEFLHVANFRPFARKYRVDLKRKVLVEDETHFKSKKKKIKKRRPEVSRKQSLTPRMKQGRHQRSRRWAFRLRRVAKAKSGGRVNLAADGAPRFGSSPLQATKGREK